MQGLLTVLPMAVVMSAGPQIVTATFLATSQDAKRNSLAFLGGVAAATTIGVTVFFLVGSEIAGKEDGGKDWLDWVFVILTVLIAGLPFTVLLAMGERGESVLPKIREWMNANSRIWGMPLFHRVFPRVCVRAGRDCRLVGVVRTHLGAWDAASTPRGAPPHRSAQAWDSTAGIGCARRR
jgi:hypothetical protein